MQDLVLRGFDQECREFVQQQYGVHGMKMHPENSPSKIEKSGGKLKVTFEPKKGDKWSLDGVDIVLMATGRNPITKGIGLESVSTASRWLPCTRLQKKSCAVVCMYIHYNRSPKASAACLCSTGPSFVFLPFLPGASVPSPWVYDTPIPLLSEENVRSIPLPGASGQLVSLLWT